jgi:hypothetical protein
LLGAVVAVAVDTSLPAVFGDQPVILYPVYFNKSKVEKSLKADTVPVYV